MWLQNDKRQLETAMVVESRIHNKRNVSRRSLADTQDGLEQSEVGPAGFHAHQSDLLCHKSYA